MVENLVTYSQAIELPAKFYSSVVDHKEDDLEPICDNWKTASASIQYILPSFD